MGILTESFRMNYQILRTKHPVYSFAVFGKNIEKFEVDNFSAYGENSPFDILRKMNGKIAILDLEDQNSMTFYHHIEEMNNVDWRYHKTFTGMYEDFEGNLYEKEYSIYVRNLKKKIITQVNPAGKLLWSNGLYKGSLPNTGYGLRVLNTIDVYEFISKIILDGKAKGVLYNQT
jgi:aminoglycoside 3-N-acetyltransferase